MRRGLYRSLVRLRPSTPRLRFEQEMFWIFDEALDARGTASLVRDASISGLRQRLIRSQPRRCVVQGIAGAIALINAFGSFSPRDRPLRPVRDLSRSLPSRERGNSR